ncbi:phosphatidylserine decarboxylase proenzyme 2-like [Triticum dicoccoides]|uniref:phosphatidylserine decarboxylase proenzyme 2-like n=1 Tax=Triticum dicoccoides TaxID=85692 RepID=UPI00188F0D7B|nr:phosphatidylserine decarboxylase proenzyme 2-like [Triticum dicoccoides]
MGHAQSTSRHNGRAGAANGVEPPLPSRFSRFRSRLRLRRHRGRDRCGAAGDSSESGKGVAADEFAGIARIRIVKADLRFKDKFFACLSLGERTYRTETSDSTHRPVWNSEKKVVIETNGPHIARISVFETNRFSKNTLVGYCEVDLFDLLTKDLEEEHAEDLALLDPSSSITTMGTISVSCYIEDPVETEQSFARRVLAIVDYNEDGKLSLSEFSDLMKAFGNGLVVNKIEELFRQADTNGDGIVDMDELAALLADQQEKEPIISNCPVCGESLGKYDKINDMIHMTLCFDEGTGNQIMTGGFLTDKQAAYGWMFKLSEWANFSSYDVGLRSGSTASHILVFDRRTKRLVEEAIDGKIVLSMRALYQSKVGLTLIDSGVKDILKNLSEKQGKKMNSPESAKDIPKFLELFAGQINMDETKDPIESFKTFNEFFIRQLKPSARPIAHIDDGSIATCAADCRLMAYSSVDESTRFWIKGRKFSIEGLLGADAHHNAFKNGSLVIFRLAPQDYHRFHVPVSGTVEKFVEIPGCLYTVNPIAVNSKYCNVFTENKRVISIISTSEFGKVAFVAIGATMVGSIAFVKKEGDYVHKGDEFGYFSFGGSTVICVFEKDAIQFDADLLANSERSLETLVEVGTTLGVSKRNRGLKVSELQKCSIE